MKTLGKEEEDNDGRWGKRRMREDDEELKRNRMNPETLHRRAETAHHGYMEHRERWLHQHRQLSHQWNQERNVRDHQHLPPNRIRICEP